VRVSAIIAAGGRGSRFGGATPKQLVSVAGRTVLERTVAAFTEHAAVHEIVVALPDDLASDPPPFLRSAGGRLRVVAGGARRQDSVLRAFRALDASSDVILIHDAARPFPSAALIARTIAVGAEMGAALAALPAHDTVKQILRPTRGDPGEPWLVGATLPREEIFLAQTPQVFQRRLLEDGFAIAEQLGGDATDEAALVARAGHPVWLVMGEATNMKITTPEDLPVAEAIARAREPKPARTGRVGTGYDLHRLVPGRPLMVGGVRIPSDRGALGHSDGDVALHAVTDAVLGAAGLGDIGLLFPDSDPQWKGASSVDLLARAVALVAGEGFEVGNVDVTVLLEAPKIRPYVDQMRAALAGALGVAPDRVSVKAKTNEGQDAVGRGEAIAAHAAALLRRA
jgi:2-C-methyl-D-erythritol 4-phosphate cytidylyltransferase / 2-C-methyl-D-erythritol 2,4-cyclodiphosphate synthase